MTAKYFILHSFFTVTLCEPLSHMCHHIFMNNQTSNNLAQHKNRHKEVANWMTKEMLKVN